MATKKKIKRKQPALKPWSRLKEGESPFPPGWSPTGMPPPYDEEGNKLEWHAVDSYDGEDDDEFDGGGSL